MAEAAKPSHPLLRWLDRAVWVVLGGFLLYRCVLPVPHGPPAGGAADVRVATAGMPVMVVFDGSR